MECHDHGEGVYQQCSGPASSRPSQQHHGHGDVHGVSRKAVGSDRHQLPRRSPWRKRPFPGNVKRPDAPQQQDCARAQQDQTRQPRLERTGVNTKKQHGDQERDHAWTRYTEAGLRIDLVFGLLQYEREATARAVEMTVAGSKVRFCTPEDLILHKIISERLRDLEDARKVVRRRFNSLDLTYLEPRIHELSRTLERPDILEIWERWKEEVGKG